MQWLRTLAAGAVVYLAVAIYAGCSSNAPQRQAIAAGGAPGAAGAAQGGSQGGVMGSSGSEPSGGQATGAASSGALAGGGGLLDPVPDAGAQTPTESTIACSEAVPRLALETAATRTYYLMVEQPYPGELANALSDVRAVAAPAPATLFPTTYAAMVIAVFVKDGAAGVSCGTRSEVIQTGETTDYPAFSEVTFIR